MGKQTETLPPEAGVAGSENTEQVAGEQKGEQESADQAKLVDSDPRIVALEAALAEAQSKQDATDAELAQLAQSMLDHAAKAEDKIARLTAERDALQAKLAKIEAEPKAKRAPKVAKARKVGPVDGQPSLDELLELIGMAETVDIAFSDGEKEIAIEPRRIEGKAWAMTAVGLVLRLPEFIVHGPLTGPATLAGYGLLLDGELVAFARRSEPLEVAPGRRMDLRNDVVFSAG